MLNFKISTFSKKIKFLTSAPGTAAHSRGQTGARVAVGSEHRGTALPRPQPSRLHPGEEGVAGEAKNGHGAFAASYQEVLTGKSKLQGAALSHLNSLLRKLPSPSARRVLDAKLSAILGWHQSQTKSGDEVRFSAGAAIA